jgi:glycosyltransferase involved in cell wall biosynthesis
MRLAFLSTFYPLRGGIAQFNASLTRALRAEGHEVEPWNFRRQYPKLFFPGKTQYVEAGDTALDVGARPLLDSVLPWNWEAAAARIRRAQPDVLLTKYWMSFFAPSLGYVASRMSPSTRCISILDNVMPHERRAFDRPLTRWFLRRQQGFVVMSSSVERDLDALAPEAPRIFLRHPLYDHFGPAPDRAQARRELGLDDGDRLLLFFGFIRAYKGLDTLLEAFDLLEGPYRLMVAGESYEPFAPYAERVARSPRRERIELRERYIPDAETALLFSAADACVLPYHQATQSGIALIAAHFGLPLIATDAGGLGEYVRDGSNGVLVRQSGPEALAQGIRRYFDAGGRAHFEPGMQALRSELGWDRFARELAGFARSLG